jgi:hypothetical protein
MREAINAVINLFLFPPKKKARTSAWQFATPKLSLIGLGPTAGPGFRQDVDPTFVSYSASVKEILVKLKIIVKKKTKR